jgi:hypothetical protein
MSLLPDFIFRAVIVRGMRTIRQDNRFLDQLFRNLDQQSAAEMREFFQKNKVYVDINYPREALKLPAIIILLKSENENQAWLGDSKGVGDPPEVLSYDGDIADEVLGGTASLSSLSGQGVLEFGPFQALSGTNNTLRIASKEWDAQQYAGRDLTVHLVAGTGAGQQRSVQTNADNTLMVSPNWSTPPDETTVFEIRKPASEVIGEPRAIYDRRTNPVVERLGSMYGLNYQIQIIGPNPELTIYLHAIIKSIFTVSRTFLEGQGIINMRMGATDFLPRTEYQPDFAYMRALNVDFLYPFDVFSELGDLADTLRIEIESCPPKELASVVEDIDISFPDPAVGSDSVQFVEAVGGENSAASGDPVVLSVPTATKVGDLLVAHTFRSDTAVGDNDIPAPPRGWKRVAAGKVSNAPGPTTAQLDAFIKFVLPDDPTEYTFDVGGFFGLATLSVFRNVDSQDPLVDKGAVTLPDTAPTAEVTAQMVQSVVGARLVAAYAGSASAAPVGWAQPQMTSQVEVTLLDAAALTVFDELVRTEGTSGVRTGTFAQSVSNGALLGHLMALRPAA